MAIGQDELPTLADKDTTRYLGVWISPNPTSRKLSAHALAPIYSACEQLSTKRVTARQAAYVLQHVAIPQTLYRTKGCVPTADQLEDAQVSMRKCIKRYVGVALDTPTALVEHDDILGLPRLEDAVVQQALTELTIALNTSGPMHDLTVARLAVLRDRLGYADLPIVCPTAEPIPHRG
ncbi:hypothetical protein RI367_002481 [Sorochytrium milnesiophthora]